MFAKIVAIVVALGVMASGVLVLRQQRYELCRELYRVHWRTVEQRQALWALRAQISRQVTPAEVRMALRDLEAAWDPIPRGALRSQARRPAQAPDPTRADPGIRFGG